MNYDFVDALQAINPKAQWTIIGKKYDTLYWLESGESKPTEEEINTKLVELNAAEPMRLLRAERDQLIATTDWRATVDYPGSDQAAWLTYRQALRDLPANSTPSLDDNGQLTGVTWPTPPE